MNNRDLSVNRVRIQFRFTDCLWRGALRDETILSSPIHLAHEQSNMSNIVLMCA